MDTQKKKTLKPGKNFFRPRHPEGGEEERVKRAVAHGLPDARKMPPTYERRTGGASLSVTWVIGEHGGDDEEGWGLGGRGHETMKHNARVQEKKRD